MACIKLDYLEVTLSEENILLEIKLATMQHYFEICQYYSEVMYTFFCWYFLSLRIENDILFGTDDFNSFTKNNLYSITKIV